MFMLNVSAWASASIRLGSEVLVVSPWGLVQSLTTSGTHLTRALPGSQPLYLYIFHDAADTCFRARSVSTHILLVHLMPLARLFLKDGFHIESEDLPDKTVLIVPTRSGRPVPYPVCCFYVPGAVHCGNLFSLSNLAFGSSLSA